MRYLLIPLFLCFIYFSGQTQTNFNAKKRQNSLTNTSIALPQDGWDGKTFYVDMDQDGIKDKLIISTRGVNTGFFINMDDLTSYRSSLFDFNSNPINSPIISKYNANIWDVINKVPGYDTLKTIYNTKLYDSLEYTYPLIQLGKTGKIINPSDLIVSENKIKFNSLLKRRYAHVAITYINNDNYPDLILASGNDDNINTVLILVSVGPLKYKLGDLTFPEPAPTSMEYGVGDMNNDLMPDIIVEGRSSSSDSMISYYPCIDTNGIYANVKSIYTNPQLLHRFKTMYKFQVNDFDNDGNTDLIIYMNSYRKNINYPSTNNDSYSGYIHDVIPTVFFNNGKNGFIDAVDLTPSTAFLNSGIPFTGRSVLTYDYNGDGFDDLFMSMQEAAENMNYKDGLPLKHWGIQYFENNKNKGFINKTDQLFETSPIFINSKIKEITLNKLFDFDNDNKLELFINNPDFRDVIQSNLKITDKPLYYYKLNNNNKFVLDSVYKNSNIVGVKIIDSLGQITQCKYDARSDNDVPGILIDELPYQKINGIGNYFLCNNDSITINNKALNILGLEHKVHFFDYDKFVGFTKSGATFKIAKEGNYAINLLDEYYCTISASNPGIKLVNTGLENEVRKQTPTFLVNGMRTVNDTLLCTKINVSALDSISIGASFKSTNFSYIWTDNNFSFNTVKVIDTATIKIDGSLNKYRISMNIFDKNKCNYRIPTINITPQQLGSKRVLLNNNISNSICIPDSILMNVMNITNYSDYRFALYKKDTMIKNFNHNDSTYIFDSGLYYYKVKYPNNCLVNTDTISISSNPRPSLPSVFNFSYCQNTTADSLKASASSGNTLLWYGSNEFGGNASATGLIPGTSILGNKNYFVTQKTIVTGCESFRAKITITTKPIPSAPTLSRDTANFLLSGVTGTTWYKDGSLITDTTQKFKPATPGSYTAKTTQNGCVSALSAPYYYLVTDIINLSKDEYIKLAPNPFVNQLNFDFVVKGYQRLNMEVYDIATGTKVVSHPNITAGSTIPFGQLASGTYIIRITSNDNKIVHQFKMVKL